MKWKIIHAKYNLAHVMVEHIRLTTCGRESAEALIARHNADIDELERRLSVVDTKPGECQECAKWEAENCQWRNANNELVRRLKAVLELLEPGSGKFGEVVDEKTVALSLSEWHLLETIHARAKAIAEGQP